MDSRESPRVRVPTAASKTIPVLTSLRAHKLGVPPVELAAAIAWTRRDRLLRLVVVDGCVACSTIVVT